MSDFKTVLVAPSAWASPDWVGQDQYKDLAQFYHGLRRQRVSIHRADFTPDNWHLLPEDSLG